MTTRSKVMAVAGFGLVAAVGISGCGSGSDPAAPASAKSPAANGGSTPKDKITAAFTSLNDSTDVGFTMTLDSSVSDLKKIDAAQPKAEQMTASDLKTAQQVLDGKVTMNVSAPEGKTFGDLKKASAGSKDAQSLLTDPDALEKALSNQGSFAMSVVLKDAGLVDLVSKDGVIYVRADVDTIAELAGTDIGQYKAMLGQLPPVIATPAQKALDGEWISIDVVKALRTLQKEGALDALPKQTATPMVDQAKLQKLMASVEAAFDADGQVTAIDGGDRGDGYRVTVPAKKIARAVQEDAVDLLGKESAKQIRQAVKGMPDKDVHFDVFVKNDKLSGVNMDLVQFLDKPVKDAKFGIDLAVDPDSSEVQVPSGATAVDVEGILGLIPASTFSSLSSSL